MAELVTSPGYKGRLAFGQQGSSAAWDGADSVAGILAEFTSEDIKPDVKTNYTPGACGHISQSIRRRRLGTKGGMGGFKLGLCHDQAIALFEAILGKNTSGTITLDKTTELPCYTAFVDKDYGVSSADTFKMNNARVKRAVLSSSQNDQSVMLALELLGSTVSIGATFPSSGFTAPAEVIFQHYELALTMGGATQKPVSVELTFDNALVEDVFRNSRDRLAAPRGRRIISGVVELDWNASAKALYDLWQADTAFTFSMVLTLVGTTKTVTIASASSGCKFDGEAPAIDAENYTNTVKFPFTFYAVAAGGDDEVSVVVASS